MNPYEDTGGDEGEDTALTGVKNEHFPDMKKWICTHLTDAAKHKVVAAEVEENVLLADVIEVLELFVKYGYYDDPKDVNAVLDPLIDLLSGFSDIPSVGQLNDRGEGEREKRLRSLSSY